MTLTYGKSVKILHYVGITLSKSWNVFVLGLLCFDSHETGDNNDLNCFLKLHAAIGHLQVANINFQQHRLSILPLC